MPVVLLVASPMATILPAAWVTSAVAASFPKKVVVRVPPVPKLASRLPVALTRATPNTEVPKKCAPATTICPLG